MWAAREADVACRLAVARSVCVAAQIVCRTPQEVEELLKARGWSKRDWTSDDRELLRFHLQRYGIERCAYFLRCTPEEVVAEAEKLGILDLGLGPTSSPHKKRGAQFSWQKWPEEDKEQAVNLMKAGYAPEKVAKRFGRSKVAVLEIARQAGLNYGLARLWSPEQDAILKDNLHLGWTKIGYMIGKNGPAVYQRAKKLGLKLERKKKKSA